jgi:hypothetical protein
VVEIQPGSRNSGTGSLDLSPELFGLVDEEFLARRERDEDVLFQAKDVVSFSKGVLPEKPVSENMSDGSSKEVVLTRRAFLWYPWQT